MIAFVQNGVIYLEKDMEFVKDYTHIATVPDNVRTEDLIIDGDKIRLKTEAEKEADRKQQEKQEALQKLQQTDTQMARAVEDIIDMLIVKGVITENDIPKAVLDKIHERKNLRTKINVT
jgi:hypothetical protein